MDQLDIQEEIFKSIETIVQKVIEQSHLTQVVASVVVDQKRDKYVVTINGTNYIVKDGIGFNDLHRSSPVWVTVPNGDYTKAYISAKR